ncbi:hypothetical protein [Kitasatospora purpeofusca]|uniref:hypothetical protein n=1 Tax=Kitasatospora purpeofusca TaxID=67352 RepID=UPI002A5AA28B|nr:hypothetical protein [Kitasatospora purpeofusca]MDY0811200.1 hypothetical protein [Kitasatospora purpeofusca]
MSTPDHAPSAVDPMPEAALHDVAAAQDPPAGPATERRRRVPRSVAVALATAGLLAVTATSAVVTVAVGRPDGRPAVTAAAGAAGASPTAVTPSTSAAPASPPDPAPSTPPTVPPAAPAPASTVKGTVSGGRHEGDLRYFLLPVPAGGESYGPVDGMPMTDEDLSAAYEEGLDIMDVLKSYKFKDAATRVYRTADGKTEVTVTLLRFGSAADARDYAKSHTMNGDPLEITGDPAAHGYVRKPKEQAYTGSMSGISVQGDVEYTVDVDVKGTPDKALLNEVMKRQRDWLTSGR